MLRNEYKTNHDVVPVPGIYNGLNFVVAHLAAAVLKEDGSTGTEVRVALKTRPDSRYHASPTGQNLCWKSIIGSYLASGGGDTGQNLCWKRIIRSYGLGAGDTDQKRR